jgi:hypothetical protein
MKHSTTDLHVVYMSSEYCGISLATEEVFTEKSEADAMCESINQESKARMPNHAILCRVMSLYDFMCQARDDAMDAGRAQERESHSCE